MVVMDLEGNRVEGTLNPSSDTKTHLILYNRFPKIGGVVHTHSPWATSPRAGRDIPCYGTTHADYIYGSVPCARNLNEEELKNYEWNTGVLIADLFEERKLDPMAVPCVLCKNHGPFTWGKDAHEAVHNAVVLEEVAKMAARCEMINPDVKEAPQCLQDKHYLRKHGPERITDKGICSYCSRVGTFETESAVKKRGGSRNLPYLNAKPRQNSVTGHVCVNSNNL